MNGKSINQEGHENGMIFLQEAKGNPFIVPTGYFDSLTNRINTRIQVNEAVKESFVVPENYFTGLSEDIHTRIAEFELKSEVPSIDYEVPNDYFDSLSSRIQSKIAEESTQPKDGGAVIPIGRRKKFPLFYRYAAAACLFLGIGTITYNRLYHEASLQERIEQVSDSDIITYLDYYAQLDDMEYLLESMGEEDLILESTSFSREEIEDYLSQNF
ncbi:hypothetical protein [Olivibacter sitiensis]|uniref:hypothetical protein n=1 Tax=Olivibacter sitiensis TaxID=376470 RepID=UPI00041C6A64|nr:hypothetical protein [Olivibacter sitiensis]